MIKRLLILLLLPLAACREQTRPALPPEMPKRIISLAPNITETLFFLGLEKKLVGVTTHCAYPAEAQTITKVGGFGQYNFEAIVSLKPDLVILHKECDAEKARLQTLGIPYLETGTYSLSDIIETIQAVGTACGAQPKAEALVQEMHLRIDALRRTPSDPPRVLLAFGGSADEDVGQIHAFGNACLHNELLELAGGRNVLSSSRPYQLLSKEAVLRLDPEIIIILAPELAAPEKELSGWRKLASVKAVQQQQLFILTNDYTCIPGPRFIHILEDFAQMIQTE